MKKEGITLVAQLLMSVEELVDKLTIAENKKDLEEIVKLKREILNFQKKISEIL